LGWLGFRRWVLIVEEEIAGPCLDDRPRMSSIRSRGARELDNPNGNVPLLETPLRDNASDCSEDRCICRSIDRIHGVADQFKRFENVFGREDSTRRDRRWPELVAVLSQGQLNDARRFGLREERACRSEERHREAERDGPQHQLERRARYRAKAH
jgi:hypothetical protein